MSYYIKKKKGKSSVWTNFDKIVNKDEQSVGFVICKNCSHIFKYDYKTETSSAPTTAKEATTKKIINLVCKDLRPFEIIAGQDFRKFSQKMINIDSVKSKLALKLKDVFELVGGAFTTDMWTDDYRKISYISLTVHYIDKNCNNDHIMDIYEEMVSSINIKNKEVSETDIELESEYERMTEFNESDEDYEEKNDDIVLCHLHISDVVSVNIEDEDDFAIIKTIFCHQKDNHRFAFVVID
ncbi:hypothetical protein C1645_880617, partial [Glomus cerebriforme]